MNNKGTIIYSRDRFNEKKIAGNLSSKEDQFDVLSKMIKAAREDRNLSIAELGKLVDIQVDQIIRLEHNAKSVPIEVILKVFNALQAEISFNIKLEGHHIKLT